MDPMLPKLLLLCLPLGLAMVHAQPTPVGQFQHQTDVGDPALQGSSSFDPATQTYTLKGSGYNIWFERDEFHYLYNRLEGDFILTANFAFEGEGVDLHRKVGWMVRSSTDEAAAHMSAVLHGDGLTVGQWRVLRGAYMRDPEDELFASKSHYEILQLERKGATFTVRAAHVGEPLQVIGSHTMNSLAGEVLAGLFVCSHNPEVLETARAWNVRIEHPVPEGYNPYAEPTLGCRLETMNVFDGKRRVIYENSRRFEAPNWMPDGDRLLFNMEGKLYTIPTEGGTPSLLDTGIADQNNNDHGISFDGKKLAISHHQEGKPGGGSTIYVMPQKGGKLQQVTEHTPSYWHGWTPDDQAVIYVAQREGSDQYNFYQKPIKGGEEVQLTDIGPGEHVDGCEYAPDGSWIYYNGNHTGTMQIWRMKPDGSEREQLTFDETNDWFPHVSPDGQWLVYLSFPETVAANDHPFCERVTLKLMPTAGGAPRVIAHLYGGQGTINVPSWSPDSRSIAFVSNFGTGK